MIQLEQVGKTFRPGPLAGRGAPVVTALADLSVRIPEGEAWAVVGPNGAGKSTLFALLLGFLNPSTGSITIAGEEPRS
ncbi:MAG TPA: ATP-binding cassette domain-containing protein, partial [Longimicrobiales bacterium]